MKSRFLLNTLKDHSTQKEISLLLGPRQTGKTTLLKQFEQDLSAQGEITEFFSLEDKIFLKAFNEHPKNLFQFIPLPDSEKQIFIFIDEIQYLDDPSNFLKLIYDEYTGRIKLKIGRAHV